MFLKNEFHRQKNLFGWESYLSDNKIGRLQQSSGYAFYKLIFCHIYEEDFRPLYSEKYSAPNAPVNCLVGAIVLQHQYNWTYEQLMGQVDFNMEVRVALGLQDFDSLPFSERTLFNFKKRLVAYELQTGINLLEKVFDRLTELQLKELAIKANIQRLDSVLLSSNIRSYTRLSLLVEVVSRAHRVLSPQDQERFADSFAPYLKGGEKYVFSIKSGTQSEHLEQLAKVYYELHTQLYIHYESEQAFQTFNRVYEEHFRLTDSEGAILIEVRPAKELTSDCLQSPDDLEATYRKKRNEKHSGFSLMATETCLPGSSEENELNLITKVVTATNNTDDSQILEENLEDMVQATPQLDELHVDGAFPNEKVDSIAEENDIAIIQTAVKGVKAEVEIDIQGNEQDGYTVNCPNAEHEPVTARKTSKHFRADFDLDICENCPFQDKCPTRRERKPGKGVAVFRFKKEAVARKKRHKAIQKIPKERRYLRSGVEPTMRQFRRGETNNGKLKVRGAFNVSLYGFAMGIVINFERIFRHLKPKSACFSFFYRCNALWYALCQRTLVKLSLTL